MSSTSFKAWESLPTDAELALEKVLDALAFNSDGLIPVIAQQHDSNEVLMLAWMNKTAIAETLQTGHVCYWSRSRQKYWRKGESSGHIQLLESMHFDCDGDAILVKVNQTGPACHTERRSCFYLDVTGKTVTVRR